MKALPPPFKALYRLVLRASSASVLHKKTARRNLIKLWRPTFDSAVHVIRDLESSKLTPVERFRCEELLGTWQKRMDDTLSFLLSSTQSRGVPHGVIRNLNILSNKHRSWVRTSYYGGVKRWSPHHPPSSREYDPMSLLPKDARAMKIRAKKRETKQVDELCWNALGEVVRMAEARHHLSLGRIRLKPWTIERY
ncbi:hypothetical protein V8B97DRAFT_2023898 [Scleroderma yunnanense]